MRRGIRSFSTLWALPLCGAVSFLQPSPVHGFGACDPEFEICFQGVGDLPGGDVHSEVLGIAYVDGRVVAVGESSSEQSHHPLNCFGCYEAFKYSGGVIRRIFNLPAQVRSRAVDVALVGSRTFITGNAPGAMRAIQTADEIVVPTSIPGGVASSISDDGLTIVGETPPAGGGEGGTGFRWTEETG